MSNEKNSTNKPRQSRFIGFELYPDNVYHQEMLNILVDDVRFVGSIHDNDLNDIGEVKKTHILCVYKFDYPTTKGSFIKLFPDFEDNLAYNVISIRSYARYLLHLDDADKTRYTEDNIIGNIGLIKRYLYKQSDINDMFCEIADYIIDNGIVMYRDVFHYAREYGLIQCLRLYQTSIRELLNDNRR